MTDAGEAIPAATPPRARPGLARITTVAPPPQQRQRTLVGDASVSGRGLFTGEIAQLTIKPAPPDQGIVFVRTDLPDRPAVRAHVDNVIDRPRRTTIKDGDAVVETIEHCMSALSGLGVDNATIEITGPEVPAGDGSAMPFVAAINKAGLVEQNAYRRPIVLQESLSVREGDAALHAHPRPGSAMDLLYDLDYGPGSALGRQLHAFTVDPESYVEGIAPARTFALAEEAQGMRDRGMFPHLTTSDMLVIGRSGPIDNSFRFADEPVRHKVLDLVGDLALVGRPVQASVIARKSGHALNHRLAREILESARRAESRGVSPNEPAMNIKRIMRLLPHRFPMVLVDRVIEIEGDRRAVGIKNVTINEPFFQGHYPGSPIMPGVLIVEAMSQLAGLMLSQKLERTGKIAILLSLDNVKLRKAVTPGDQLVMETEAIRATERFGDVQCRGYVGGQLVAEAKIKFMMVDAEQDAE